MVLLDTCTLPWLVAEQKRLSRLARDLIRENGTNLYVSSISALEIGIKARRGKLILPNPPANGLAGPLSCMA